jgi:glycosyltransferase involved in cell wall biosynthesis
VGPGNPAFVTQLHDQARRLQVAERMERTATVEPAHVVDAIRGAAFGFALFQPVCLSHRLVAPNKVFEYMAAGVPALASDLPVLAAFVRERGLGETVEASDVHAIARAARSLLEPSANLAYRRAAVAAARDVSWERERSVLQRAYDQAIGASRR